MNPKQALDNIFNLLNHATQKGAFGIIDAKVGIDSLEVLKSLIEPVNTFKEDPVKEEVPVTE